LITHKKYYTVNKISHNMIPQPTTSIFILYIPVIIKNLHSIVTDTNDINL